MQARADRGILKVRHWRRHSWLVHGFSTRAAGDFLEWPPDDVIADRFGAEGLRGAMLRQIHSCRHVRADGAWGAVRPAADAVTTDRSGVLVGVRTADCLPVLLVDPRTRTVGAVHAGWRGAATGVLQNAVRAMVEQHSARPCDVEAAIGPGIGPCCFEVGEEVARRFGAEFVTRPNGRPHVDLAGSLGAELAALGVQQVENMRECTSCNLDRFFSHRAERGQTGRMLSVAGLRMAS